MSANPMSHEELVEAAEELAPLFRAKAREAELARRAPDDVIEAVKASGSRLDSPIQRALRDIQTASNHVFFDRESRYADYGRILTGQGAQSLLA
ncbi:MAG: hypothetical protein NXI30_18710 [bacterium]|nr:hypothetical protein [bacterium]